MDLPIAKSGPQDRGSFCHPVLGVVQVVMIHDNGGWVVRTCSAELWLLDRDAVAALVERRRADGIDWSSLFPEG